MKKLLSSLATLTLIASTTSGTVVACGSRITAAQQESDQVNNKTVTLNDTASAKYEKKTAQQDTTAIDNAIVAAGYLNKNQVQDFNFNNTTMKLGSNVVNYTVKASDGSTASGSLKMTINPARSTLTPSDPKASTIGPSTPTTAKKEHDLINDKNVTLNDTASLVYEGKTIAEDKLAIDQAIMTAGYLNATQLKDFTFNNSTTVLKVGKNVIDYTIKAHDGSTMTGSFNVTINHQYPPTPTTAKKESDQVNNKTITLNDTASATYENKTAQQDISAIDNAIVTAGYLNTTQVKDFSFDNTTVLKTSSNAVSYNVKAPDGSTASGTLNVVIIPNSKIPAYPINPSEKKASTIVPSTPTTAKKESDQVNNKTITLNDTASATYENKTAQQDTAAIDNALVTAGYLNTTQVKDFSFDNTTILKPTTNSVTYNVKAPDGSTASGTLNVTINPYKPTPPTPSTAQQEANKVNNQTVTLNDSSTTKYEDQTAQQDVTAIDNAIVTAGYLNTTQVKDFSFDNSKNLTTGTNTGVSFTVNAPDKSTAKGSFNIVINPYKPTPPTPGKGGLGKSKSVPFLDVTSVSSGINDLTPDKVYNTFGVHQVMLAFVSAYDNTGASWVQGVKFNDMSTPEAKWIQQYEALGGSVGISFGGAVSSQSGSTPWDKFSTSQIETMLDTAVTKYHVKAIDYDIEPPGAFNTTDMQNLVNATNAELTKDPNLDISLTLASLPVDKWGTKFWGSSIDHSSDATQIFKQLKKTPIIDPMAFDFGSYYNPTVGDYPALMENVATTAAAYWGNIFNKSETDFLQNNIELTSMIGRSDQSTPQAILTPQLATDFAQWAKTNKLFRLGFWCLNRDFPGPYNPTSEHNSGTNNPAGTYAKINEQYFEQ